MMRFILSGVCIMATMGSAMPITSPDCDEERSKVPSFESFIAKFGRTYTRGTAEYTMRREIFEKRTAEVKSHNCMAERNFVAAVNKLTDRTDQELSMLRGWRGGVRPGHSSRGGKPVAELLSTSTAVEQLPESFSWKNLTAVKEIQDQGGCGSCWAFASATVLRAHSEIWMGDARQFSVQELVSCTQNPHKCGGTGGCNGATAELAMDYVFKHGLRSELEFPYQEADSTCPRSLMQKSQRTFNPALRSHSGGEMSPVSGTISDLMGHDHGGLALGMTGWTKLPENKLGPLKLALVTKGPVAVSISAGYSWNSYGGGILDNCPQNAVIDHAVMLIGYGHTDSKLNYWTLQNSWGKDWGEGGYIRMLRKDDEETKHCGWDDDPMIGSGCEGSPPEVYVCGMCGLLYDTVIPHFTPQNIQASKSPGVQGGGSFLKTSEPAA